MRSAPIERWHLLPGYLDALVRHVQAGLTQFPAEVRAQVPILFTAHSLPQRILDWQDPYPTELQATVEAVMQRLGAHTRTRLPINRLRSRRSRGWGPTQAR